MYSFGSWTFFRLHVVCERKRACCTGPVRSIQSPHQKLRLVDLPTKMLRDFSLGQWKFQSRNIKIVCVLGFLLLDGRQEDKRLWNRLVQSIYQIYSVSNFLVKAILVCQCRSKERKITKNAFWKCVYGTSHSPTHVLVRNFIVELSLSVLSVFSVTLGSYIALIVTHSIASMVSYNTAPPWLAVSGILGHFYKGTYDTLPISDVLFTNKEIALVIYIYTVRLP
jgi:hypothetical protein